jgi:hypothetical protein
MNHIANAGTLTKKVFAISISLILLLCQGLVAAKDNDQLDPVQGTRNVIHFQEFGSTGILRIDIPSEGTVVDARLGLEGKVRTYLGSSTTYSYADNYEEESIHRAWKGGASAKPPKSGPHALKVTKATSSDKQRIASDDQTYWTMTTEPPWNFNMSSGLQESEFPYHMFEYNISDARNILDRFTANWNGYGIVDQGMMPMATGATMYFWNPISTKWEQMDSYSASTNTVPPPDQTFEVTHNINLLQGDAWPDTIYILVMGNWVVSADKCTLNTDMAKLTLISHTRTAPHDLTVDVNDDGEIEHTYIDEVKGIYSFGEPQGFVDALQLAIDNSDVGSGGDTARNISVPINFTSRTGGTLEVWVETLNVDTPPKVKGEIADIEMQEDENKTQVIDLTDHFTDDGGSVNLTYEVVFEEKPAKVHAAISGGHMLDLFAVERHWSGTSMFRISATDARDQTVECNNFTVSVHPVNDLPVLGPVGDLTAHENKPFTHDVNASDPDNEKLTFSDDTDLFDIDPETGLIEFTPTMEEINDYDVNISVTDENGTFDFEIIKFTVKNVNDPPEVTLYLPTDGYEVNVDKVKLVWIGDDLDGDDLRYDLYVDRGSGIVLEVKDLKDTEYMLENLENGTTYKWTVEAKDGKLSSKRPDPFSFKVFIDDGGGGGGGNTSQPNQPPSVDLQKPEKGTTVKTLLPTLTWNGYDPDGDKLTYDVYLDQRDGTRIYLAGTDATLLTITEPLDNNKRYYWTVIPYDGEVYGVSTKGIWWFTVNRTGTTEPQPPVVNVTQTPAGEIDPGDRVTFDASASSDPDGTITLYIWTFGDGATLTGSDYQVVEHKYEEGGVYDVSLVLFDNDGKTAIWNGKVGVKVIVEPPPPPPPQTVAGLTMEQLLIALAITALLVAFGTAAAFMMHRRIKYGKFEVEQLFLVYRDGRLISHAGATATTPDDIEREKSEKEVLGGMLSAVQDFVADSLKHKEKGELSKLEYGDFKIALERGKHTFLAAFISGNVTKELRGKMKSVITEFEVRNESVIRGWDGDIARLVDVDESIQALISKPK